MSNNYGLLEYSYTYGFNETMIINFYIDQRLRNYTKLKEGDRISVLYDPITSMGGIFKVNPPDPSQVKLTEIPKLTLSNTSNPNGKVKAWYDMNSDYYQFVLLPFDILQEQVPIRIIEARKGYISFTTGNPRTAEQVALDILNNWKGSGKLSTEDLNIVQERIREIKTKLLQGQQ
jgi:hypothetical protein